MKNTCIFCNDTVVKMGTNKVLEKYDVAYYHCPHCGFIQTETPYWLAEAYCKAIADEDTGYVRRNLLFARFTQQLIQQYFLSSGNFLDYGSGYGLFVRLMRDSRLNFFAFDEYCTNLFAKQYQVSLKEIEGIQFEMITCFEVFEHFVFPVQDIQRLLRYCPNLLFSTELVSNPPPAFDNWVYYSGNTGQHIAFYSLDTLKVIAHRSQKCLYSDAKWLHLFTEKPDLKIPLKRFV